MKLGGTEAGGTTTSDEFGGQPENKAHDHQNDATLFGGGPFHRRLALVVWDGPALTP
jgi:hypothetical protein